MGGGIKDSGHQGTNPGPLRMWTEGIEPDDAF